MYIVWMYDVPLCKINEEYSNRLAFETKSMNKVMELLKLAEMQGYTVVVQFDKVGKAVG